MTKRTSKLLTISMSTLTAIIAMGAIPTQVQAQQTVHTVNQGEYLYNIAPQYGVSVDDIIEWNQLDSVDLQIGDELIIHSSSESTSEENVVSDEASEQEDESVSESSAQKILPKLSSGQQYIVKAGDYLYKIANNYGVTVNAIIEANNLSNNNLQIGDILIIPTEGTTGNGQQQPSTPEGHYTVVAGDYLYKIANKFGTTVDALKNANGLTSNNIQIADVLVIPGTSDDNGDDEQPGEDEQPDATRYTVVAGDSLYKIANKFGTTVDALKKANGLTSNNIQIGDVLVIPGTSDDDGDDEQPGDDEHSSDKRYTVVAGDYLYKIANKFGTTVDALKKANGLTSDNIQIGDVLVIPGASDDNGDEDEQPTDKHYTVVAGDYLYKIANKFGITVDALKKANGLTSYNIQIGDVLVIPGASDDNGEDEQPDATRYTVVAGDYLYKIANKFGITVDALKKANGLTSDNIQIGDVLVIPGASDDDGDDDEQPSGTHYTVVAGDYLYKIANKFGITVDSLKKANGLTSNNIQIGDVLIIPGASDDNGEDEQPDATRYTVVAGDYLYKIANKFGITVDALKKANGLTSNNIQIGDVLVIPGASDDDEEESPEFVAPKPGDPAYMPNMSLVKKAFSTITSAVNYAESHFDYTKHENYFVNYHKGYYVLYFKNK